MTNDSILDTKLGELPLVSPITVTANTPIAHAIETMTQHGIGCVLTMDSGEVTGIFTERDVMRRVVLLHLDLQTTAIEKVMTQRPECLTVNDSLGDAIEQMLDGGYRHLPVLEGHKLRGVLGLRDCIRLLLPDSFS